MKAFGYIAAAAVASIVAMAPAAAHASASDDLKAAALAIISNPGATNYGTGGSYVSVAYKNAFSYSNAQMTYLFGASTVSSAGWFDAITSGNTSGNHFDEVTNIANVAPGQVFVIDQVFDDASTAFDETYAGHTAVVLEAPVEITPPKAFYQPYVSGTKQWVIKVADSTNSRHGSNATYPDTRPANGKPGTGYIRLYTDATTGEFYGYTWSVTSTTNLDTIYDQSERPFAFGLIPVKPL